MSIDNNNNNTTMQQDNNNNNPLCNIVGCNSIAQFKITTLDHKFVYSCLKHYDTTMSDNKENVFNIILLEE